MCTLYINVYVCRKVLNLFVSHCWTFIAGFTAGCKWMLFLRTMYWCCVHTAMWKSLKKKNQLPICTEKRRNTHHFIRYQGCPLSRSHVFYTVNVSYNSPYMNLVPVYCYIVQNE
jgi:hypothetical protein